uniref:G_PROTEIN_RECEP_F1_2 domain-containing protein n=1 Tax=Caenorhabditis japonica TaxID=281687 RepID=A0A8R1DWW5_CAEJA
MSSSTNAILIGIAISDIISAFYYFKKGIHDLQITGLDKCESAASYKIALVNWVMAAFTDCFRRSSSWLCLLLVVMRTIVVNKVLDKKFYFLSDAKFGWKLTIMTIFISSLLTIAYVFRYQIEDVGDIQCGGTYVDLFWIVEIGDYSKLGKIARHLHLFLTGIFSKVIPSFLFPVFAIILTSELRRTSRLRGGVSVGSEKTTKLVIYMTIMTIVIEFPIGICKILRGLLHDNTAITVSTLNIESIFDMIYVPLTATHFFLCFAMSSQYRNTVKRTFEFSDKNVKVTTLN